MNEFFLNQLMLKERPELESDYLKYLEQEKEEESQ